MTSKKSVAQRAQEEKEYVATLKLRVWKALLRSEHPKNANTLAGELSLTRERVSRLANELVDEGKVRRITGRDRVFSYWVPSPQDQPCLLQVYWTRVLRDDKDTPEEWKRDRAAHPKDAP